MALTIEQYWAYRKLREARYQDGEPMAPVDRVPRFVIPPTGWTPPKGVARALREISPHFEIIYDPLTRRMGAPPDFGCHLYTIGKSAFAGGFDELILEVDLQWDTHLLWPKGRPRAPGMWLVDWVKRHDKATMPGDEAQVNADVAEIRMNANLAQRAMTEAADREVARYIHADIHNAVNLRRTMTTPRSCKLRGAANWWANPRRQ